MRKLLTGFCTAPEPDLDTPTPQNKTLKKPQVWTRTFKQLLLRSFEQAEMDIPRYVRDALKELDVLVFKNSDSLRAAQAI